MYLNFCRYLPPLFYRLLIAILRTQKEALNKLRATRHVKPIGTFFENLFPESKPVVRRAPLICGVIGLFDQNWAGADGEKVQVFTHDAVNLLGRTAAGWKIVIIRFKASATHAEELWVQVATLKSKLANPTEGTPGDLELKAAAPPTLRFRKRHKESQRGSQAALVITKSPPRPA